MDNLLSHSTEKLRRGTLLCSTKFLVLKFFLDNRGGGVVGICVTLLCENFLFHSAENFRSGTFGVPPILAIENC